MQIDRRRGRKINSDMIRWWDKRERLTQPNPTRRHKSTSRERNRDVDRCTGGLEQRYVRGRAEWKHIETVGHVQQFEIMWKVVTTQWFWITDFYWPIVESEHLLKINFQKQNCHKLPRGLIGGQNLKLVSDLIGWIDTKNFLMRKMKEWTRLGDYISFPCHGQELMTKNDDVISRHNGKI